MSIVDSRYVNCMDLTPLPPLPMDRSAEFQLVNRDVKRYFRQRFRFD